MIGSSFVDSPLELILTWGILAGIGTGSMAMVLGVTIVNRWFESRRGTVLGLLTASTATGQLVFLPVLAWVVEHHDWRVVVWIVGIVALALIPVVAFFLPERPGRCRSASSRRDAKRTLRDSFTSIRSWPRSARCATHRARARSGYCSSRFSSAA